MLEKIDLSSKLDKEEYKKAAEVLRERLGELQRAAKDANMPVMIVFEGWEASGKGTLINELILPMDPRGFRVYYVRGAADDNQSAYWPPMKRFWAMTPPRGRIGVFNRSWYRLITDEADSPITYGDISSFERQLSQDGYVIIKFFLHISKKEQKKRLKKLERDESSRWRTSKPEGRGFESYDETAGKIDEMIQYTDRDFAPWTIVEATDKRYAAIKILSAVVKSVERGLEEYDFKRKHAEAISIDPPSAKERGEASRNEPDVKITSEPTVLRNLDLTKKIEIEEYNELLPKMQKRLRELQYELYRVRRPMVIVFEGQDAAGKGGCIKRLTQRLDPRGYQVSPTGAPNDWERSHHYLWRFWNVFPKAGHIGIYDRSWYGRVMVERVEGFTEEADWRRAYGEINEMEDGWARGGAIIVKFWLQIDGEEQLRRFQEREEIPEKNWKITAEDWRNREKWPAYEAAIEDMMLRTSTTFAPWTLVEANDKLYARVKVLRKSIHAIETAIYKN
ncbi:polyphosphate:AMP phosphotransferase [Synergistales bacterium]|nr:polyphosphate:AMP phosphotransferase [Synergistales bacterium]